MAPHSRASVSQKPVMRLCLRSGLLRGTVVWSRVVVRVVMRVWVESGEEARGSCRERVLKRGRQIWRDCRGVRLGTVERWVRRLWRVKRRRVGSVR